jgi:hypothetical protein
VPGANPGGAAPGDAHRAHFHDWCHDNLHAHF